MKTHYVLNITNLRVYYS